jgi:hypothetical protein
MGLLGQGGESGGGFHGFIGLRQLLGGLEPGAGGVGGLDLLVAQENVQSGADNDGDGGAIDDKRIFLPELRQSVGANVFIDFAKNIGHRPSSSCFAGD